MWWGGWVKHDVRRRRANSADSFAQVKRLGVFEQRPTGDADGPQELAWRHGPDGACCESSHERVQVSRVCLMLGILGPVSHELMYHEDCPRSLLLDRERDGACHPRQDLVSEIPETARVRRRGRQQR